MNHIIQDNQNWQDNLFTIQNFCTNNKIRITKHAAYRLDPDDTPNPSVLLMGNIGSNPVHLVVGIGAESIQIITAYYPSDDKWESDNKTRKAVII